VVSAVGSPVCSPGVVATAGRGPRPRPPRRRRRRAPVVEPPAASADCGSAASGSPDAGSAARVEVDDRVVRVRGGRAAWGVPSSVSLARARVLVRGGAGAASPSACGTASAMGSPDPSLASPSTEREAPDPRPRPRPPRRLRLRAGAAFVPGSEGPVASLESPPDPDRVVSISGPTTDVVCVSSVIREAPFLVPGAVWSVAEVRDLALRAERVPSTTPSGVSSVWSCS
jgi:hypothetical protein